MSHTPAKTRRLNAAAPEMLDALLYIKQLVKAVSFPDALETLIIRVSTKAIAKAEGKNA